jgi:hypothetical protein
MNFNDIPPANRRKVERFVRSLSPGWDVSANQMLNVIYLQFSDNDDEVKLCVDNDDALILVLQILETYKTLDKQQTALAKIVKLKAA